MSSIYNPNGTLPAPTSGATVQSAIVSSTDATPIVLTTAATTWNDQDTIEVEGHLVNTNANGIWVATKIDSSHWSLNGSTGTGGGAGGATGYGTDYSVTPALTIIGDGDLLNAANLNPPVEGAANLGPFLYRRLGKYRTYQLFSGGTSADNAVTTSWASQSFTTTSFVDITSATSLIGSSLGALSTTDLLEIHFEGNAVLTPVVSGTSTIAVGLSIKAGTGGQILIPGTAQLADNLVDSLGNPAVVRISLHSPPSLAGVAGSTFQIGLQGCMANRSGHANSGISLVGSWSMVCVQYRAN